jgi:erythromycin esterase
MRSKVWGIMSLMVFFMSNAYCQAILNLDFDESANRGNPLSLWTKKRSPNFKTSFSNDTYNTSGTSLKIDLSLNSQNETIFLYTRSLPIEQYHGKIISISARIKITRLHGNIRLYGSVQSEEAGDRLAYVSKEALADSFNLWQQIQIDVPIDSLARRIAIGFQCQGLGVFNVDAIKISTNGQAYTDLPLSGTQAFTQDIEFLSSSSEICLWRADKNLKSNSSNRNTSAQNSNSKLALRDSLLVVIPVDSIRGKKLKFKVSPRGKTTGNSNLYFAYLAQGTGVFESNERYSYTELHISGKDSARTLELERMVPNVQFVKYAALGVRLSSEDSLCFDGVHIEVDSIPFDYRNSQKRTISDAQIKWLSETIIPITEQADTDLSLIFSGRNIPNSVIGLGEVTHGASEIYLTKSQIIKYLVSYQKHRKLFLEADIIACRALDHYIKTGKGNLEKSIKDLGFWTLQTREVIELMEWLRIFNLKNQANPVRIYGTDCQSNVVAKNHFKKEFSSFGIPTAVVENVFMKAGSQQTPNSSEKLILNGLASLSHEVILKQSVSDTASLRSKQNLKELYDTFIQYAGLPLTKRKAAYRDAIMAENVFRLTKADTTGIIWSHNTHVSKAASPVRSMGSWLEQYFKSSYLPIAFTFGTGTYKAISGNKILNHSAQPAEEHSFEQIFSELGHPAFYLNLKTQPLDHNNKWLHEMRPFRRGGAEAGDHFNPTMLTDHFDAILFNMSVKPTEIF